jgi:mono/diheme cytochrome c family protein
MTHLMKYGSLIVGAAAVLVACNPDPKKPGYEYMPDMYYGPAFEAYSVNADASSTSALKPAEGSIPRGFEPYDLPNTPEAYAASKGRNLGIASMTLTEQDAAKAAELYRIFCSHCHGEKGDGNGILVEREKILGVPSYAADRLPDITDGSIYHVITHGKGVMGAHASQISPAERKLIVAHVLKLRTALAPAAPAPAEQPQS